MKIQHKSGIQLRAPKAKKHVLGRGHFVMFDPFRLAMNKKRKKLCTAKKGVLSTKTICLV